jgi:transposase
LSEGQDDLDEREKAIKADIDRGLKYSEIAKIHHVSPKTIKSIKDKGKKVRPTRRRRDRCSNLRAISQRQETVSGRDGGETGAR